MKTFITRAMLTAILPPVLIGAFIITLCHEIVSAFGYAWLEVQSNFESYKVYMRRRY